MFAKFYINVGNNWQSHRLLVAAYKAVAEAAAGTTTEELRATAQTACNLTYDDFQVIDNSKAGGWSSVYFDSDWCAGAVGEPARSNFYPLHMHQSLPKLGRSHKKSFSFYSRYGLDNDSNIYYQHWAPRFGIYLDTTTDAPSFSSPRDSYQVAYTTTTSTTTDFRGFSGPNAGGTTAWYWISATEEGMTIWTNNTSSDSSVDQDSTANAHYNNIFSIQDTVGGDSRDYTGDNGTLPYLIYRGWHNSASSTSAAVREGILYGAFTYDTASSPFGVTSASVNIHPGRSDTTQNIDNFMLKTGPKFMTSDGVGSNYEILEVYVDSKGDTNLALYDIMQTNPLRGVYPRAMKNFKFVGYYDSAGMHLGINQQGAMDDSHLYANVNIIDEDGGSWWCWPICGVLYATKVN